MSVQGQQSCPSCENEFDPEQYGGICPECYTTHPDFEDDETDEAETPAEQGDEGEVEADAVDEGEAETDAVDEGEAPPEGITLVVNGERYSFDDGDTFGRGTGGPCLEDLIEAAGGKDEVSFVSSEHLEFSIEDDGAYVTDVSSNGTALNGSTIDGERAKVEDGDTLTLAERAEVEVEL